MKSFSKEWVLSLAFSLLMLLALGLGITWVNIERVDMAYELKRLQTEIDSQEALISKLEVERNTLLTPERLRTLAGQYGLTQARPGQIRRLSSAGNELPSPVIKAAPVQEKPQKKADAAAAKPDKASKKKASRDKPDKTDKTDKNNQAAKESGKSTGKSKRTPVPYVPDKAGNQGGAGRADAGGKTS